MPRFDKARRAIERMRRSTYSEKRRLARLSRSAIAAFGSAPFLGMPIAGALAEAAGGHLRAGGLAGMKRESAGEPLTPWAGFPANLRRRRRWRAAGGRGKGEGEGR